jgi:hypothetical protein
VFTEIAKVKPKKLFVIADGPRVGRPDEENKCSAARSVIDRVNWDCEVMRNYSDTNLGCGRRPATGISWVFEHVEEAIILEDDCVPDQSFFYFCEDLLKRFRNESRVMMIAGSNHWHKKLKTKYSYFFSQLPWTLGWATWKRAWQSYDFKISKWPGLRETAWLHDILPQPGVIEYWNSIFDKAYSEADVADYWDYQWAFNFWEKNGFCIYPNTNLIRNIGFREDASHIKNPDHIIANMKTHGIKFPLQHPPIINRDKAIEEHLIMQYLKDHHVSGSLMAKIARKIARYCQK